MENTTQERIAELSEALESALLGLDTIVRNGPYLNIGLRKQGLPQLDLFVFAKKAARARKALLNKPHATTT